MSVSKQTNRFAGEMSFSVSTQTNRFAVEMSCQGQHKPICWRNAVSVSKQIDLLEKCRVIFYKTNIFAGEMSCQCLHKETDLLEKCRVSVYTNKPICWRIVASVSTQTQ